MKFKPTAMSLGRWAIILVASVILGIFIYKRLNPQIVSAPKEVIDADTKMVEADLLGIGSKQQIHIVSLITGIEFRVFNSDELVASKTFPPDQVNPSIECESIKLNLNENKDYLRCDEDTGPHQKETRLLTIHQGSIYTIPSGDFEKGVWYEPFWSSRGKVVIGDINNDGFAEIIEFVSEYPADTPRLNDPEVEKITQSVFDEYGISQEVTDNAIKIVDRENLGKGMGRKVILGIHTFTNNETPLIRKLRGDEYDQLASKIIRANQILIDEVSNSENGEQYPEIIKITDLSQESIDFNDLVRNTFSYSKSYEYPMAE
jgi:hypothetical protein